MNKLESKYQKKSWLCD